MATAEPTARRRAVQAAVLAATEDLLREGASYADLSIEAIARRAGLGRTAFYFYFRDKRELLMRLTEDVNDQLFAQADVWFSGRGDPAQELRAALTSIAALYDEHGVLLRAIVEVSTYDEEVARFWRGLMGRFTSATRRRIEREQAEGRGASGHPEATAFSLCWMTERVFYQRLVQDEPPSRDELVGALCDIWVRSVYGR
jgi:AcrR family transcriptional regulator